MSPEVWRRGRVSIRYPGKHGDRDCRVEFNGAAPTHEEIVAMLAWVFWAERRYEGGKGPLMLMDFLDEVMHAETQSDMEAVLDRVRDTRPQTTRAA